MNIRLATIDDLQAIVKIEKECFPPAEACTEESFRERLRIYPNHFWLLESEGEVIGAINGMVTNKLSIEDEMFEESKLHDENGDWQALFGVTVLPQYQRKGYAAKIMESVIADSRVQSRKGVILTCKEELLDYYAKFGFKSFGLSKSSHGGAVWYDMRLEF